MAKYLIRASYTAEGVKGLLKDGGTKRRKVVTDMMKPLGITVESFYYALGDADVYLIVEAPDLAAVTAVSLTTNASGAVKVNTTVLMTPEEVDAAVQKSVSYTPPGR